MNELVALDLAGSERFVEELQRAWDTGDAVLPLDQRLPTEARRALAEAMHASRIVGVDSSLRLHDSRPIEVGDALVVATSGSTGASKGVVLSHAAVRASALASSRALEVTDADHWLACLPLSHIGGLSVITRALHTNIPLTVVRKFDAETVTRLARQCTLTSLVPTALGRIDSRLFRRILLGGSRPPNDLPPNVVATYGMTETGSGIAYNGKPLEGVDIHISDDGEILVRGPMVMRTYRDGTSSIDEHGWLHTDDIGEWLSDGRLRVIGRRGDMINTGGEKVWPEVVEKALADHISVDQFCIVGLPDDEWGERVVLVTTRTDLALADIRTHVGSRLPGYCAPREIRFVETIPRTALGKPQRTVLRSRLEGLSSTN